MSQKTIVVVQPRPDSVLAGKVVMKMERRKEIKLNVTGYKLREKEVLRMVPGHLAFRAG